MSDFKVEILSANSGAGTMQWFDSCKEAQDFAQKYNEAHAGSGNTIAKAYMPAKASPFQRVVEMNEAFGNGKGDSENIDWQRIRSQCKNIFDEYLELLSALGVRDSYMEELKYEHEDLFDAKYFTNPPDAEAVRDALCDIQVFANGAQYLMGYNGDNDMDDVIDGVMSRFIKSPEDKEATIALHAARGVTKVYFEGEYPKMVMKSAVDQPDAPRHKFLKAASFKPTEFRDAP